MKILLITLTIQAFVLLFSWILLYPNMPYIKKLEDFFGDYEKVLMTILGSQFVLIVVVSFVFIIYLLLNLPPC